MTLSKLALPVIFISLLALQGCAAVAVGAAAVGISSATDPRTIGTQVDDQTIEMKTNAKLGNDEQLEDSRVIAVSYDTNVLLIGQVPSESLKRRAEDVIRDTNGINKIFNQLRIGSKASATVRAGDSWITSKVKLKFANNKSIDATNIKVVTENGEVFLLGHVSQAEAEAAVEVARNVDGVGRVIKALTIKR
ncbi:MULTISPECIES: division/outer membrane stress-associated lipid-binding lipoprotein [Idiomarina]|jgi:osmotically-inducible protein OsmY|uniref:Divisome-associated lipoprotein YraP n=1 Tax=Idiomarina abyssalis TaxID=86102 RepID=A0A8I1GD21_9GAMM|nr:MULTISPECIES: division/outer membrane stress-associated lipid-binding lipoprotein [Idiomarina]MAL83743.1 osmotically-inducible protein OsmY [Idiomarina sp.]MBE91439.1 osmotically-inducible protein OsmY [Idiomarina sp.]MBF81186.1 osmotically-inducible protein OsmY [Idiomarina sp.]MBJ7266607.1 divisome-associated lipoprotein YraP [Idiomarina abyssalis]MBJ7273167.1 divisome-associated lipoprotein YraP [Idiomarina abyssalis]|tara:strand:+ start:404 stop:979 length:576 start_codon:yes stop_codon:yes gene_type:complete